MASPSHHELFPIDKEINTNAVASPPPPSTAAPATTSSVKNANTEQQIVITTSQEEPMHEELFPSITDIEKPNELFPITDVAAAPPPIAAPLKNLKVSSSSTGSSSLFKNWSPRRSPKKKSAPPPKVMTRVPLDDDKKRGNAIDVIVFKSTTGDNEWTSTPWTVQFNWSRFKSSESAGVGDRIQVRINDTILPSSQMILREKGRCDFRESNNIPCMKEVRSALEASQHKSIHRIRYEHVRSFDGKLRVAEATLHLWDVDDSIVVADLDGTLTVSDVEGHIRTMRLGQYDYLHAGSCEFFSKVASTGCRILYLTARPIDWANLSRVHLEKARQATVGLPTGALITNSSGLTGALYTEVINKNPNVMKAGVLNTIQRAMILAGRTSSFPVYTAGFGNRPTDVAAYEAVGIDREMIFLIDPNSKLVAMSKVSKSYRSYDDPESLMWLFPKLKRRMPLKFVEKIDAMTANEVVRANEAEEMRMSIIRAQQLQLEEDQIMAATTSY